MAQPQFVQLIVLHFYIPFLLTRNCLHRSKAPFAIPPSPSPNTIDLTHELHGTPVEWMTVIHHCNLVTLRLEWDESLGYHHCDVFEGAIS